MYISKHIQKTEFIANLVPPRARGDQCVDSSGPRWEHGVEGVGRWVVGGLFLKVFLLFYCTGCRFEEVTLLKGILVASVCRWVHKMLFPPRAGRSFRQARRYVLLTIRLNVMTDRFLFLIDGFTTRSCSKESMRRGLTAGKSL